VASKTKSADSLAGRYAAALYELASDADALDVVAEDLKRLGGMVRESADLRRLIRSPVMSRVDQGRAMGALIERTGLHELVRRFVGVLSDNRRLFALPDMIQTYLAHLADSRGEVAAQVTSAKKLTERQLKSIGQSLESAVGRAVAVDATVDPSLLGGLVVQIGSRMVDSSLRTKLQQMRLAMKGVG
jgi:F-type H+-transporting ATPase subunit delta